MQKGCKTYTETCVPANFQNVPKENSNKKHEDAIVQEQTESRGSLLLQSEPVVCKFTAESKNWAESSSISADLYNTQAEDSVWGRHYTLDIITDCEVLAEVLGGKAVPEVEYASTVGMVLDEISAVMVSSNWGPRNFNEAPVRWRRRCFNKEADYLANLAMDSKHDFHYVNDLVYNRRYHNISNIQGWCDGG